VKTREYKSIEKSEFARLKKSTVMRTDEKKVADGWNVLGDEGWELAGIESHFETMGMGMGNNKVIYVFKREKR